MPRPINVPLHPDVARAIDELALPGEKREETVARIVWAWGLELRTKERKEDR